MYSTFSKKKYSKICIKVIANLIIIAFLWQSIAFANPEVFYFQNKTALVQPTLATGEDKALSFERYVVKLLNETVFSDRKNVTLRTLRTMLPMLEGAALRRGIPKLEIEDNSISKGEIKITFPSGNVLSYYNPKPKGRKLEDSPGKRIVADIEINDYLAEQFLEPKELAYQGKLEGKGYPKKAKKTSSGAESRPATDMSLVVPDTENRNVPRHVLIEVLTLKTRRERQRRLRKHFGWSQPRLKSESGVGLTTIKDIEEKPQKTHRPKEETTERISAAFGVEPCVLEPGEALLTPRESNMNAKDIIREARKMPRRVLEEAGKLPTMGQIIMRFLEHRDWPVIRLVEKAGVGENTLYDIIKDRLPWGAKVATIQRIAHAINVKAKDLIPSPPRKVPREFLEEVRLLPTVGRRIQKIRKEFWRWTLDILEEKSGVDRTTIWRIENDPEVEPLDDTLKKLARALKVPKSILLVESAVAAKRALADAMKCPTRGMRLIALMYSLGKTRKSFSQESGVSVLTLKSIEEDTKGLIPDFVTMARIALSLGVSINVFPGRMRVARDFGTLGKAGKAAKMPQSAKQKKEIRYDLISALLDNTSEPISGDDIVNILRQCGDKQISLSQVQSILRSDENLIRHLGYADPKKERPRNVILCEDIPPEVQNAPTTGGKILAFRESLGLSRMGLALRAGVGDRTIYDMEHGKRDEEASFIALARIALVFGINIDTFPCEVRLLPLNGPKRKDNPSFRLVGKKDTILKIRQSLIRTLLNGVSKPASSSFIYDKLRFVGDAELTLEMTEEIIEEDPSLFGHKNYDELPEAPDSESNFHEARKHMDRAGAFMRSRHFESARAEYALAKALVEEEAPQDESERLLSAIEEELTKCNSQIARYTRLPPFNLDVKSYIRIAGRRLNSLLAQRMGVERAKFYSNGHGNMLNGEEYERIRRLLFRYSNRVLDRMFHGLSFPDRLTLERPIAGLKEEAEAGINTFISELKDAAEDDLSNRKNHTKTIRTGADTRRSTDMSGKQPDTTPNTFEDMRDFQDRFLIGPLPDGRGSYRNVRRVIRRELPQPMYALGEVIKLRNLMDEAGCENTPLILWRNKRLGVMYPYLNDNMKDFLEIRDITILEIRHILDGISPLTDDIQNARYILLDAKLSSEFRGKDVNLNDIRRFASLLTAPVVVTDHSHSLTSGAHDEILEREKDAGRTTLEINVKNEFSLEDVRKLLKQDIFFALLNANTRPLATLRRGGVSFFDDRPLLLEPLKSQEVHIAGEVYNVCELFRELYGNAIEKAFRRSRCLATGADSRRATDMSSRGSDDLEEDDEEEKPPLFIKESLDIAFGLVEDQCREVLMHFEGPLSGTGKHIPQRGLVQVLDLSKSDQPTVFSVDVAETVVKVFRGMKERLIETFKAHTPYGMKKVFHNLVILCFKEGRRGLNIGELIGFLFKFYSKSLGLSGNTVLSPVALRRAIEKVNYAAQFAEPNCILTRNEEKEALTIARDVSSGIILGIGEDDEPAIGWVTYEPTKYEKLLREYVGPSWARHKWYTAFIHGHPKLKFDESYEECLKMSRQDAEKAPRMFRKYNENLRVPIHYQATAIAAYVGEGVLAVRLYTLDESEKEGFWYQDVFIHRNPDTGKISAERFGSIKIYRPDDDDDFYGGEFGVRIKPPEPDTPDRHLDDEDSTKSSEGEREEGLEEVAVSRLRPPTDMSSRVPDTERGPHFATHNGSMIEINRAGGIQRFVSRSGETKRHTLKTWLLKDDIDGRVRRAINLALKEAEDTTYPALWDKEEIEENAKSIAFLLANALIEWVGPLTEKEEEAVLILDMPPDEAGRIKEFIYNHVIKALERINENNDDISRFLKNLTIAGRDDIPTIERRLRRRKKPLKSENVAIVTIQENLSRFDNFTNSHITTLDFSRLNMQRIEDWESFYCPYLEASFFAVARMLEPNTNKLYELYKRIPNIERITKEVFLARYLSDKNIPKRVAQLILVRDAKPFNHDLLQEIYAHIEEFIRKA